MLPSAQAGEEADRATIGSLSRWERVRVRENRYRVAGCVPANFGITSRIMAKNFCNRAG